MRLIHTEDLPYNGPPELASDWKDYAQKYLQRNFGQGAEDLTIFNELAFGLPPVIPVNVDSSPPLGNAKPVQGAIKDFIRRHGNPSDPKILAKKLGEVAKYLGDGIRNDEGQSINSPLNLAIVRNLVRLWLALEKEEQLPDLPTHYNPDHCPEYKMHMKLYQSPEGKLVAQTIRNAAEGVLSAQSTIAATKYCKKRGLLGKPEFQDMHAKAYAEAYHRFKSSLFRYEAGQSNQADGGELSFIGYLTGGLHHLDARLTTLIQQERQEDQSLSNGLVDSKGDRKSVVAEDTLAIDPADEAVLNEEINDLSARMQALTQVFPVTARAITLRYGLEPGSSPLTFEAVGNEMGFSHQAAQQNVAKGLEWLLNYNGAASTTAQPASQIPVDLLLDMQRRYEEAGYLLAEYRERADLTQKKLGQLVGLSDTTINNIEAGISHALPKHLDAISSQLDLKPKEKKELLWLVLPAFNPIYLDQQAPKKQGGLLLEAYRLRRGLTRPELAEISGLSVDLIYHLESGRYQSIPKHLPALSPVLRISKSAQEQLLDRVKSVAEQVDIPALNPEWLDQKPAHKQAGLLLAAYRMRKGMTQEEFAEAIGRSPAFVAKIELGTLQTIAKNIEIFRAALDLSGDEVSYLLEKAALGRATSLAK